MADSITGVCFDAIVFFYTDTLVLQMESEIHIISILAKNIDVQYILNPQICKRGFPNMFESAHCEFDFKGKKGLLLKGSTTENVNYSILIQPTGKDCESATLAEKQGKINN